MNKKALFFDIDGTLWDRYNHIPDSTREAIKRLHENGHYIFINSGRATGFIFNEDLLSLDFDGIVSACGTTIDYHGDRVFCRKMDIETIEWVLDVCRQYSFAVILEGPDYLYMNQEDFTNDVYVEKITRELGERLKRIESCRGSWDVCKFSVSCDVPGRDEGFKVLSAKFNPIPHNPAVAEFVPLGYSKGTGIVKVCELLEIAIENTYAFGDSNNDLDMLKVAGTGICMGDGYDSAKEAADYVTTDLMKDGIYNACVHFGLI